MNPFKNISRKTSSTLLFLVCVAILFASSQYNFFKTADEEFFKNYQLDSQDLIIGRIDRSRNDGMLSDAGRLGRIHGGDFIPYNSQIGLQGMFFSAMDALLDVVGIASVDTRLAVFHATASLLFSIMIASIVVLFSLEIGWPACVILLSTIVLSQWLVVSGRNLYWLTGLMYAPMLAVFVSHKYEEINGKTSLVLLYSTVFILTFIKSAAGYEFISTLLIATTSPVVYFAVKNKWPIVTATNRVIYLWIIGCLGFLVALLLHIIQLNISTNDFSEALHIILDRILTRTHDNPLNYLNTPYYQSQLASTPEVINLYWNGIAANLGTLGFDYFKIINFEDLILVFLVASAMVFFDGRIIPGFDSARNKLLGLMIATWFSFFAPISWFVFAKSHSYIHGHINHVLWQIPFTIFGFALVGYVISLFGKYVMDMHKRAFVFLSLAFLGILILSHAYKIKNANEIIKRSLEGKDLVKIRARAGFDLALKEDGRFVYFKKTCSNIDRSRRFFLHVYPSDSSKLIDAKSPFNSLDFEWRRFSKDAPFLSFYSKSCIAVRHLPNYGIDKISTGQLVDNKKSWEEHIDTNDIAGLSDFIVAYNLSDGVWDNGISRSWSGFFVENSHLNRLAVKIGSTLEFPFSGQRNVVRTDYSGQYINVFVDGGNLNLTADGYPNKIRILREDKN